MATTDTEPKRTALEGKPATELPLLITVNDVAAIGNFSVRHVWRMVDSGQFPRPLTIGSKLKRWRRADIVAWINAQTPTR